MSKSFSEAHSYRLYAPIYYGRDDRGTVYLSSMPSREDVVAMLRAAGELDMYPTSFVDHLVIERPHGWYYKTILVYAADAEKLLWEIEPSP